MRINGKRVRATSFDVVKIDIEVADMGEVLRVTIEVRELSPNLGDGRGQAAA
jgi:hypothetical protein